jgi:hypothetical protein
MPINIPETNPIQQGLMAELQKATDKASQGIRDPEGRRQACDEMDRIREGIRAQYGVLDIGVPAIREVRDSFVPCP